MMNLEYTHFMAQAIQAKQAGKITQAELVSIPKLKATVFQGSSFVVVDDDCPAQKKYNSLLLKIYN